MCATTLPHVRRYAASATRKTVCALAAASALAAPAAFAHSASDAYLTLDVAASPTGDTVIEGQWDIALRDLDFVLGLDADGDGDITWRELRPRQAAIDRYAYAAIAAGADGKPCALRPTGQRVSQRADGAYAALAFEMTCKGAPSKVTLDYRLFFAVDPSHRCILVVRNRAETATALLSPANAVVELRL
jgi:hypothetical protein